MIRNNLFGWLFFAQSGKTEKNYIWTGFLLHANPTLFLFSLFEAVALSYIMMLPIYDEQVDVFVFAVTDIAAVKEYAPIYLV